MVDAHDPREANAAPADAGLDRAEQVAVGPTSAGSAAPEPIDAAELRRRAEGLLDDVVDACVEADLTTPTREGLARAIHELRVHQIELEMQNEELRQAQLALDEQREKYFDLYDRAPVGYLTIDGHGIVTNANLTSAHLLGVQRQMLVGRPLSAFVFTPDRDAYYLHIKQLESAAASADFELRLQRPDRVFSASIQARPRPSATSPGETEYRLTFASIEELKRALEAEHRAAERLDAVIASSHDIIYTVGADGVFRFVSPSWERLLGQTPAAVVGHSFEEFVHPDDLGRCSAVFAQVVEDARAHAVIEYRVLCSDGSWLWVESSLAPVFDSRGQAAEYVGNARDITERKSDMARMQAMAMTDELTGIGNRRQFLAAAATEFERARRHGHELSMLLSDLDHLKEINDTLGHEVGDRALQIVGEICQEVGRGADAAGRLGGDEFAILLPHSGGAEALEVGERLRERVEREPAAGRLPDGVALTVSIGLSTMQPDDSDYTGMLRRSDHALYRAKQGGRNRTCT